MKRSTFGLFALALLLGTADLEAQRRRGTGPGRPGGNQPGGDPAAAPPAVAMDRTKVRDWTVIENADYVYLGTGQVMRFVSILVGDDKIYGVGSPSDLEVPAQAKRLDVKGRTVAPGFVAVRCSGLGSPSSAPGKVADSVNPFDPMMKAGLAAGITSFLLTLDQGSATPDGKTALIKLAYGDLKGMVGREDLVLFMRVPLAPQQLNTFKDLVKKIDDHKKALAEHAAKKDNSPAPKPPAGTEKLLRVVQGEAKLWISMQQGGRGAASDVEEIRQALEISKLIGRGVALYDPLSAWVIASEIAAHDCQVIVNPRRVVEPDPARPDTTGSNLAQAKILADAGVPVAVTCPSSGFGGGPSIGTGGIMGQDLNTPHVDAAYAVRGGLDNRDALRTLCADSATIIGVADRVGTIEVGKDADLLILDGDPLHYKTFVQVAIVNGKVVYEKDREPFYQHVNR
jgi:hypothetical protein